MSALLFLVGSSSVGEWGLLEGAAPAPAPSARSVGLLQARGMMTLHPTTVGMVLPAGVGLEGLAAGGLGDSEEEMEKNKNLLKTQDVHIYRCPNVTIPGHKRHQRSKKPVPLKDKYLRLTGADDWNGHALLDL